MPASSGFVEPASVVAGWLAEVTSESHPVPLACVGANVTKALSKTVRRIDRGV
jgi:hypothetical protein